jgi:hypothetical protein
MPVRNDGENMGFPCFKSAMACANWKAPMKSIDKDVIKGRIGKLNTIHSHYQTIIGISNERGAWDATITSDQNYRAIFLAQCPREPKFSLKVTSTQIVPPSASSVDRKKDFARTTSTIRFIAGDSTDVC